MLGRLLWGTGKLVAKYVVLPIAVSVATAMVADALAQRMRARTAALDGGQTHLDVGIDPALSPAP
jgi:hypothetical protein